MVCQAGKGLMFFCFEEGFRKNEGREVIGEERNEIYD
jgi:hypothetical protein